MSDQVAAASSALGVPEALVQRSASARAAVSGVTVDDLLNEWAGGESAPRAEPAAPTPAEETVADEPAAVADTPPPPPEIVIDVPPPAPVALAPAGPYKPPVLVGARDNPMVVFAGAIGLFLVVVLVGLVGPSIPVDSPGARSSEIAFTDPALDGKAIYSTAGCVSCHTQMVRPVVADVGLGAVTLADTDQVLGTRRFGPDLSDAGSRLTGAQIEATIGGLGDHPAHNLSPDDLAALVAYLVESKTSSGQPEADS